MDSFIWPLTSKLSSESVKSINNLLKIFSLWSERPYYYPLLAINTTHFNQIPETSSQFLTSDKFRYKSFEKKNVLDVVFELINQEKCASNVIEYVMDMVYNLVSFADFKEDDQEETKRELMKDALDGGFFSMLNTKPLPFDVEAIKSEMNVTLIKSEMNKASEINFGTCILKPHVTSIVDHIERIVTENLAKKNLPSKPLKILAR